MLSNEKQQNAIKQRQVCSIKTCLSKIIIEIKLFMYLVIPINSKDLCLTRYCINAGQYTTVNEMNMIILYS